MTDFVLTARLVKAAASGDLANVKTLLAQGASIQAVEDYSDSPGTRDHVIHDALREAVYRGHTDVAACLLEQGADIHCNNNAALYFAMRPHPSVGIKNKKEILRLLLTHCEETAYQALALREAVALLCEPVYLNFVLAHIFKPEFWIGKDEQALKDKATTLLDELAKPVQRRLLQPHYLQKIRIAMEEHGLIALSAMRRHKTAQNPIHASPPKAPKPL